MLTFQLQLPKDVHFVSMHQLFGREEIKNGGAWFVMLKHAPNPEYVGTQAVYGRGIANDPSKAVARAYAQIEEGLLRPSYLNSLKAKEEFDLGDISI